MARSWSVLEERFDDLGESSETLDRPALKRLLQLIAEGRVAQVVVASVDRLTRRLFHLQKLLATFSVNGVELGVVCDPHYGATAGNRLMANIVAAASEFQQEMTRERMTEARKALKSKGRRVAGRVPFGFDKHPETKQLVLNPHEAEPIRTMFEMAAAGKRPQEISDYANSQGWRTRSGLGKTGAWTARQVLKVLANPIYTGSIRNGVGTLPGIHEAIVTAELFQQVREVIQSRRSRIPGREKPSPDCVLQGRITCGQCGRLMSPSSSGYKNLRYRYYRCRSRSGGKAPCPRVCISAFEIEEFIRESLCRDEWEGVETHGLSQDFRRAWSRLTNVDQWILLKDVLSEVVFDPVNGSITLNFVEDATSRLPG